MAVVKPRLIINGHDYAQYIEELNISRNDLDADGSGRDVQNGTMIRKRIATKLKITVKMCRIQQPIMTQLAADIQPQFFSATVLNPSTGEAVTKRYYTSTVPFGAQRYNKDTGIPYYDGVTFDITEE